MSSTKPREGTENLQAGAPSLVERADRFAVRLLLLVAVLFNLYSLLPEVTLDVPPLNDTVLHVTNLEHTLSALVLHEDPTDHWLANIDLGYPLFHYYQQLPYLIPAFGEWLSLLILRIAPAPSVLLSWVAYLLLALFPLSIYWSMRRFGFARLPSASSALASSLLSTNGLYGFDFNSYVWGGYGLYTQLWGMVLLPPALAQGYVALKQGRGYFLAVLLLSALLLSHLMLGYVALVSLVLIALIIVMGTSRGQRDWLALARLALILILAGLVTAYFFVPFIDDGQYLNRSVWELASKYDAYGWQWTLTALFGGQLFDYGRLPVFTLLVAAGLVAALYKWREERMRIALVLFVAWLLLYFGRPSWGTLLNLLPLGGDLQLHRFIAGVHLAGIMLIGSGLGAAWEWIGERPRPLQPAILFAAAMLVLFLPAYAERSAYLKQSALWKSQSGEAFAAEEQDLTALFDALRALPPGRVYAGLGNNWGKDYRVGAVPMYARLQSEGFDMVGYLYHALSLNGDVEVQFNDARAEQYDLFNIRYVVVPSNFTVPSFYKAVGTFGRHALYQVDTSGYFELVGSPFSLSGAKADWFPAASAWLKSGMLPNKQFPVIHLGGGASGSLPLTAAPALFTQQAATASPLAGRVNSESVASDGYQAEVDLTRASVLMLKVTFHPDWHAYVDGSETAPVMLMPSYLGVPLSPGTHHIEFAYRSEPSRGVLMLIGLLALLIAGVLEWRSEWRERLTVQLPWTRGAARLSDKARPLLIGKRASDAREWLAPRAPYWGAVALLTLIAGLPLLQLKMISGHDALEYLPRNVEFFRELSAGDWIPRWAPDLGAGYGEPFFVFNPPLIYYVSALFHAMGADFIAAADLACLTLLLIAGFGMYCLGAEFFGRRGGLASAAAYLFAPYLLVNLYVRQSLSDFAAFAFMPFAVWGLYRYTRGGQLRFLFVGSLALALLMLSSNPVALIFAPVLVLLIAGLYWKERRAAILQRGILVLALGLGLSAFFWVPALAERNLVHYERLFEGYLNYGNHFVYLVQLLYSPWGYGYSYPGLQDGMSFAMGVVPLLMMAVAFWFLPRLRRSRGYAAWAVLFALVVLVYACFFSLDWSRPIWDRLALLQYLEFPWRMLSVAALAAAFICGFPFALVRRVSGRRGNLLLAGMILALLAFELSHAQAEKFLDLNPADYSADSIAQNGLYVTTRAEEEPIFVKQRPPAAASAGLTFISGAGRLITSSRTPRVQQFTVEVEQPSLLQANLFYFPGWTLHVDGAEQPVSIEPVYGTIQFSLTPGQHQVELAFGDTPIRSLAGGISVLSILLLWLTVSGRYWRRKSDPVAVMGESAEAVSVDGAASDAGR